MLKNPLQYSISTMMVVTFLVAIGMTVGPAAWFLVAVLECVAFYFLLSYLDRNLPTAIASQMRLNRFRADGSFSSRRETIEKRERKRFIHNVAVLFLLFLVITNFGLLVLRIDRVFDGETYVVDSPKIVERPGRMISESQYASEIGAAALRNGGVIDQRLYTSTSSPLPPLHPKSSSAGSVRFVLLLTVGSIWLLAALLIPIGYLGMLKNLALGTVERAEDYRNRDYRLELEKAS